MNKPQQTIKINPSTLKPVICPMCGGKYFDIVAELKELPGILSPNGLKSFMQIPFFRCVGCLHIIIPDDKKEKP